MNRTIKFRAWDKKEKKMVGVAEIAFAGNTIESIKREGFPIGTAWVEPQDVELMQFTGMEDTENREIYEGDWVRGNPVGSTGYVEGKVIWINDGWYVSDETERDREKRLYGDFFFRVKVLGNAYERPE